MTWRDLIPTAPEALAAAILVALTLWLYHRYGKDQT